VISTDHGPEKLLFAGTSLAHIRGCRHLLFIALKLKRIVMNQWLPKHFERQLQSLLREEKFRHHHWRIGSYQNLRKMR
jgi:hypothetical protein